MNRRIRKKRRIGEFNYKGFKVTCTFDPPLADVDRVLDEYIAFCEAHNLGTGGGMSDKTFEQFVTEIGRPRRLGGGRYWYPDVHATEADRALVWDYLSKLPGVQYLAVSGLIGAWS